MKNKNRIIEIDLLKGFGILLMIIGHVHFSDAINHYIYSFHMPLFFIVSGYLYKSSSLSLTKYILKQIKNLLIPYVFFGAIFTALFILLGHPLQWKSVFMNFYSSNHFPFDWCGAIWFLLAMFWVKIIFEFSIRLLNRKLRLIVWIMILCLGVVVSYSKISLPLCLDSAFIGCFLYVIGYGYRKNENVIRGRLNTSKSKICFMILLVAFSGVGFLNSAVNMRENYYGNFLVFLVTSISGTALWGLIFNYFKNNALLQRILIPLSNDSIAYMGINQFLIAIINVYMIARISSGGVVTLAKLIETIAVILIIMIVSVVMNKSFLKIFIGK